MGSLLLDGEVSYRSSSEIAGARFWFVLGDKVPDPDPEADVKPGWKGS